jgi:hypothetical protein
MTDNALGRSEARQNINEASNWFRDPIFIIGYL